MKISTREIIFCGLFAALISILSQISIPLPFTAVPFTMQIFAIFLTGLILGSKSGFIATLIYLFLGLIGLPVFTQFRGGICILFGPTGGFLLGYPLMVLLIGYTKEKCNSQFLIIFSMILGLTTDYLLGTIVFSLITGNSFIHSIFYCVIPFIPMDILKLFLANKICEIIYKRIFFNFVVK